jgi:uncharacterized protein (DUF736 family)
VEVLSKPGRRRQLCARSFFNLKVKIVPVANENAKGPDYRVVAGAMEMARRGSAKADLSIRLDDPSFLALLNARLGRRRGRQSDAVLDAPQRRLAVTAPAPRFGKWTDRQLRGDNRRQRVWKHAGFPPLPQAYFLLLLTTFHADVVPVESLPDWQTYVRAHNHWRRSPIWSSRNALINGASMSSNLMPTGDLRSRSREPRRIAR